MGPGALSWVARVALQFPENQEVEEGGSLLRGRGRHWGWRPRRWLEGQLGKRPGPLAGGCWCLLVLRHGMLEVLRGVRCCWTGRTAVRAAVLGRRMVLDFRTSQAGR